MRDAEVSEWLGIPGTGKKFAVQGFAIIKALHSTDSIIDSRSILLLD